MQGIDLHEFLTMNRTPCFTQPLSTQFFKDNNFIKTLVFSNLEKLETCKNRSGKRTLKIQLMANIVISERFDKLLISRNSEQFLPKEVRSELLMMRLTFSEIYIFHLKFLYEANSALFNTPEKSAKLMIRIRDKLCEEWASFKFAKTQKTLVDELIGLQKNQYKMPEKTLTLLYFFKMKFLDLSEAYVRDNYCYDWRKDFVFVLRYINGYNHNNLDFNDSTTYKLSIAAGNLTILKGLLTTRKGPYIGTHSFRCPYWNSSKTPLMTAAEKGYYEIVKHLVDNRVEDVFDYIEVGNNNQRVKKRALDFAKENKYEKIEKYLEDIRFVFEQEAKLRNCVVKGDLEGVKECVKRGVNINAVIKRTGTPLMLAMERGYLEIARYLVKKGANVNFSGNSEKLAASCLLTVEDKHIKLLKNKEIVEFIKELIKKSDLNFRCKEGHPLIYYVVRFLPDNADIVEWMLENGADPNARGHSKGTLLYWGIGGERSIETIKVLLKYKADPNLRNRWGDLPIHTAMMSRQEAIVKLLIENGSIVTMRPEKEINSEIDRTDNRVLKGLNKVSKIAKLVIEHTKDLDREYFQGVSCLLHCLRIGYNNLAKELILGGANVNHRNKKGETAMQLAIKKKQLGIMKLLVERDRGAKIRKEILSEYKHFFEQKKKKN